MRYLVDIHTHTIVSSHAFSTIHDYISEAKRKGLVLFATTDHGPEMHDAPHEWHFVNSAIIPRIVDGVGILRGIEANIKNTSGDIDCNDKMMNSLDIVLAGFHEQVFRPNTIENNTLAMVNAIKQGKAQVITHPGNPKFPIDIQEVVSAAAKHNVALEINNASFLHSRKGSKENCIALAQAVKNAGGWVSLGSDSHIAFSLGDFEKCIELLQCIDFPAERILNRSARTLLDFLESHGRPHIPELAQL